MPQPFDLEGPLPSGTSVLEASAGTGKTYTIARLVSRYIASGAARMDELLVVSFSRESSRELRERVRERLVADRDTAQDPQQRDRLDRALANFDGATVTTTHAFCHAMLRELGTAADHDRDAVLLESPADLITEVAEDLYVRKWGHPNAGAPELDHRSFRQLADTVARDPSAPLVPEPDRTEDPAARLRARIAIAAREEVDRRKRLGRLIDYDDMVLRLDAALQDPETATVAASRMRARFRVVLVDEFQDTDPMQWRILRTAFHDHATLVLVGDPKQAIYGFRGADVRAYLDAQRDAATRATLPHNFRSDAGVLDGLGALFAGAALGEEAIRVVPVSAAHSGRMISAGAAVELRVVPRAGHALGRSDLVGTSAARVTIRQDVARQVVALLGNATLLRERPVAGRAAVERALHPGDIAVIVRKNAEATAIQDELRAVGVPAVVSGRTSVFTTPAALEWQRLLEALEQPHRKSRVRKVAIGRLVGLDAATLATAPTRFDAGVPNGALFDAGVPRDAAAFDAGDPLDELGLRLRQWGRVLNSRGVAALFEAVSTDLALPERLLAEPDGERLLTDLRHVGEVLHQAALESDLGLSALAAWLHRRREEQDESAERSRRLETDADAVQILTSHMSKGLEFPVVLAPTLWDYFTGRAPAYPRFHDEAGVRTWDVGGPGGADFDAHVSAHREEDANEELRLAYVTLTRAQAKVITWWAPTANTAASPLNRLLLHNDPATVAPMMMGVPSDVEALALFGERAASSDGALSVASVPVGDAAPVGTWVPPSTGAPRLDLASFTRGLDLGWRRTSYSALTAAAHEAAYGGGTSTGPTESASVGGGLARPDGASAGAGFASEPETAQKDDESDVDEVAVGSPTADDPDAHLHQVTSLWHDLAGGTGFGTLVHRVLELLDPAGPQSVADLVAILAEGLDAQALTTALEVSLATPMGPLVDGLAFGEVTRADLLPELDFELPLAGGDDASGRPALLGGLVGLWRTHVSSGVLAGYADALTELGESELRGYLSGSIDAVIRVGSSAAGNERYLLVDHKTNRLAPRQEQLTAWHYRATALEDAMIHAHYPLQAVLYAVALHRYLRWRRAGYDPDVHLGGVLYLFLRGMSGPGVIGVDGQVPGVFAWRPPSGLVVAFSDLLAGEGP